MICCTSDGITERAAVPREAALAGRPLRKKARANTRQRFIEFYCIRLTELDASSSYTGWLLECMYLPISSTLERMAATKLASFMDAKLMSTLAKAPFLAASANPPPTVRSEAMLLLVIDCNDFNSSPTSLARWAISNGTWVAPFRAASMMPSPSDEVLASL